MISRIIKVKVGVISWSRRLRLITLTETLIILDITKTESNNCFILHWTNPNNRFIIHWTNPFFLASPWHKMFQSLCQLFLFLRFSQFFLFYVIRKQLLWHLRRPVCVFESLSSMSCWVNDANLEVMFLPVHWRQATTERANLTWLPLEIMHRGHTWHDYPWPWVSLTCLLYDL